MSGEAVVIERQGIAGPSRLDDRCELLILNVRSLRRISGLFGHCVLGDPTFSEICSITEQLARRELSCRRIGQ
jgi:hypothetical protein